MARPSKALIGALRTTSQQLLNSESYQWGHMGACNCGHLAQQLTQLTKGEIHAYAMRGYGDWTEQVEAFCPTSAMPMDLLISEMIGAGLALEDLMNLERLRDQEVLGRIPKDQRDKLRHNNQSDVALYLSAWADLLEGRLTLKSTLKEPLLIHV